MKYRELMKKDGGNLSWCKPVRLSYKDKIAIIAQNEGRVAGLLINGKNVDFKNDSEAFSILTKHLEIDGADNLSDLYNYLWDDEEVKAVEMECRNCPWFNKCCAMDEKIE